jgi:YidC/Oxa1 family membrane protein insertase
MIFTWMPVIFTFMLSSFPAGLVIYWAWNNTLSVTQQYVIMRRQGVDVDLLGNIMGTFRRQPAPKPAPVARRPVEDDPDEAEEAAPPRSQKAPKPKKPGGRARPRKAGAKARG